jgi:hypothetical protein
VCREVAELRLGKERVAQLQSIFTTSQDTRQGVSSLPRPANYGHNLNHDSHILVLRRFKATSIYMCTLIFLLGKTHTYVEEKPGS